MEDRRAATFDSLAGWVGSAPGPRVGQRLESTDAPADWSSGGWDDRRAESAGGPGRAWAGGRRAAAGRRNPAQSLASAALPRRAHWGPGRPAWNPLRVCPSRRTGLSYPLRAQSRCRAFAEDRVDRAAAQPANTTRGSGQAGTLRNRIPTLPQWSGSALAVPQKGAKNAHEAQQFQRPTLRLRHLARAAGGTGPGCTGRPAGRGSAMPGG